MYTMEQDPGYNLKERRKKRKQLRARRRLRLFRGIFVFLLFITTCILLATSSLFTIKQIEVGESRYYKSEQITGVISLAVGNNAFKSLIHDFNGVDSLMLLRYGKSEEIIEKKYPYIKEARVKYVIPGKVVIDIIEREPFAIVTGPDINLLIDRQGFVLDTVKSLDQDKRLIINGVKFDGFQLGQALTSNIDESINMVMELLKAIDNSDSKDSLKLLPIVEAVNLSDLKNIKIYIDSRITVNIGNIRNGDDLSYKINYLKQIVFKHITETQRGAIDFTTGENPRFTPALD